MTSNASNLLIGFSSQCFPVRSLTRYKKSDTEDGGAWLVAYRAEQRRRFKAVLSNEPQAQAAIQPTNRKPRTAQTELTEEEQSRILDGFFLMKEFHVDDPCDLCAIKISGKDLREVKENDFLHFDNVVHVDAGDNNLPFAAFRKFLSLKELELPLNNLHGAIHMNPQDFPHLQVLDLSYNRLTSDDILALGMLQSLKTLHLTGNEIRKLPVEMARTYRTITGVTGSGTVRSEERRTRFPELQNLYLDHNELTDLSTFASLAGLKRLKYLNLENNEISSVPHLRLLGARLRPEGELDIIKDSSSKGIANKPSEGADGGDMMKANVKADSDAEKETQVMDEVDEILSRKLPGDESQDEPEDMQQAAARLKTHSSTLTEDPSLLGDRYNPPHPFQHLLHLNLANNLILEEEGLLALGVWPALRELVIWGNPLTTAFKGDPPVLTYRLGRMNGVRIFRKKPPEKPKPQVDLISNQRKVNDTLPPKPRKRTFLMLEGPKQEKIAYVGPHPQPLPPIGNVSAHLAHRRELTTPRQVSTAPGRTQGRHRSPIPTRAQSTPPDVEESVESRPHPAERGVRSRGHVTSEQSVGTADREMQAQAERTRTSEDAFFMTQIDEMDSFEAHTETLKSGHPPGRKVRHKGNEEESERPFSVEAKYRGFEDLLDVDETDPEIVIPKDIQRSVRALHYTLTHPLIFTETGGTYTDRRKDKAKINTISSVPKSRQSKVEELGDILDKMRVGSKTVESNLENVLKEYHKNPRLRKEFPEVKKLLNEVQTKYNEVRVASLKPASAAARLFGSGSYVTPGNSTVADSSAHKNMEATRDQKDPLQELKKFKERIDSRL